MSKNIIVKCPICGQINAVPKEKENWKCRCKLLGETGRTRKYSIWETALDDQTSLILECRVTSTPSQGIQMAYCNDLKQVTIKGYQAISAGAFQDCAALCTVKLFKGVETIEERAFAGCSSLEEIVLPDGLKRIGMGVFQGSGLKRIILPDSVGEIDNLAFADCSDLEEIILSENLARIGSGAFQKTSLKSMALPDSVTSIGKMAFAGCSALKKVVLTTEISNIKEGTFQNSGLKDITLKSEIKLIGSRAFAGCSFLEEIVLPDGLDSIGEKAFRGSGLKRITLPDSVRNIAPDAFDRCCHLEEIKASHNTSAYIPFAELPQSPFLERHLAQCTREDGVVENHTCLLNGILTGEKGTCLVCHPAHPKAENVSGAFAYLPEITELRFEPGTQIVDKFMFRGCRHLKCLTLPDGLKKIEEGAFADCTALEKIVIPESVLEIAPFAFGKCTSLATVEISERLFEKLDSSVFASTPFAKSRQQADSKPWRDILIVGLGTSAGNIVSSLKNSFYFRHDALVLDRVSIQEERKEICSELQKHDFVIVVVRLGGDTGSIGAPVLAQWLQELKMPHLFITSIPQPLNYESKRRIIRARQSILEIKKMGTVPLIISNKWVRCDSAFDGYMRHDFAIASDMMYRIVQNMLELINLRELDSLDFYYTDSILGNADYAHIYRSPIYGGENLEEIAEEIIKYLPITRARDFIACFLRPYDADSKEIDNAKMIISKSLPTKTNFICSVVLDKSRDKPNVLFITTEDDQEDFSLKSDSITLLGGYPVWRDELGTWDWSKIY